VGERVARRLRLLRPEPKVELPSALDDDPCCVYGLMTRTTLDNLAKDVDELKTRVNALLWGVGSAVLIDIVMRLAGQ
jgi:hypothetical protein